MDRTNMTGSDSSLLIVAYRGKGMIVTMRVCITGTSNRELHSHEAELYARRERIHPEQEKREKGEQEMNRELLFGHRLGAGLA